MDKKTETVKRAFKLACDTHHREIAAELAVSVAHIQMHGNVGLGAYRLAVDFLRHLEKKGVKTT